MSLTSVSTIPGICGARLKLPNLEQGTYEVIVNSTVKGSISGKTVSNTVTFEVEGGTSIGEGARYYINESFDGYKGGMPADFDAAQYADYSKEYAAALTQTEHENNGKAIKLGGENDTRSLEYQFSNKIYGGKMTVEFDVKHSNGGWAVGLMSAGDFDKDTDYVEINRYNQLEQNRAYAYWKEQYDNGTITDEWNVWQKTDARKSVFTTWQTENPDSWLNLKKTEITNRKNKNFLIGNTNTENVTEVYSAKSKSNVGTDILSGASIPANAWMHVKAVIDIDAGTGSFYLGESTTPYTITFTQPSSANNTYKDARFARDEFTNTSNTAKAPNKIVEGLMGIRLQKTAGSEVEFDNVKVYTEKSYNDFQNFDGKVAGTAVPGWYFAGTKNSCNYMYDAHRPESKISVVSGKTGKNGDLALKLNNDTTSRYYIHPFEVPVKAATPFTVEFDVKNDETANAKWMFALMEEAYMHQTGANTKKADGDAGIAENGEVGIATDAQAFLRRNILSNFVYNSTDTTYAYGKMGYIPQAYANNYTNMKTDTGLTLENGKWNHVKVLIEPVSSSYGADMTVTVTNESGVSQTSNKLRLHTRGSRFYDFDTYGCGFYTNGCTIDNLKVSQVAEEYKTIVTSINTIDVNGNAAELDGTIGTNELQLEVNLSSAVKSTNDIVVYYPEMAEGQKPTYTVETQDYGKKVLITLTDFEVGENITIYVSNKADIGTTYISKPSTTAATFKIEQSEGELKVTDFRLYEYVEGRSYVSGSKTLSCEGAWVPVTNEMLRNHTDFNNLKLIAKGYNTGSETEVLMIAGFYENGEKVRFDTCGMDKKTIYQGTFSEEYLIENQETTGDKLKIFIWNTENIEPLADSLEYYLPQQTE